MKDELNQAYGGMLPGSEHGNTAPNPNQHHNPRDATMTSTHTGGHALGADMKNELVQNQNIQASKNL